MKCLGLLAIAAAVTLAGCGLLSDQLVTDARDYNNAIERTVDQLMVVNILRARDRAPMHFADVPLIHESLQLTGGVSPIFLFGPLEKTTTRESAAIQASAQITPSFDLDNLDTKDFATGMASPVDSRYIQYWLDRGVAERIILLLFFPSFELVYTPKDKQGGSRAAGLAAKGAKNAPEPSKKIVVMNAPRNTIDVNMDNYKREHPDVPTECRLANNRAIYPVDQFSNFLTMLNAIKNFHTNSYSERKVLDEGFKVDVGKNLRAIGTLDPTKLQLIGVKSAHTHSYSYNLYAPSSEQKIALCYTRQKVNTQNGVPEKPTIGFPATETVATANGKNQDDDCTKSVVDSKSDEEVKPPPHPTLVSVDDTPEYCTIFKRFLNGDPQVKWQRGPSRSPGEMFQFLGDLVYYQESLAEQPLADHNNPLTLGYCEKNPNPGPAKCEVGGALFDLPPAARGGGRFAVNYRGKTYEVPENSVDDHTLQIIAILNQMVNLNKSATDIKVTPFVQTLP